MSRIASHTIQLPSLPINKRMGLCFGELFLFFSTLLLLLLRPKEVSMPFIYVCFGDFIASTFLYFKYKSKKNYLDFDTLFVLLFGILGFAYPVFMFDADNPFSIAFNLSFDVNYIPLGVACFVLGIQSYYIGGMLSENPVYDTKQEKKEMFHINNIVLSALVILFSIAFILAGGVQYYQSIYKHNMAISSTGPLLQILALLHAFAVTAIATEFYNKCVDRTYKLNKILLIAIVSIILLMLYAGNRTLASQLALPILGLFALYFKNIGKYQFLLFLILGIVFMWIIQINRTGNTISTDDAEVESIISDLTIPTRSTYSGMEYVEDFGHTYGLNMLGGVVGTIPSLERLLVFLGVKHYELSSAELLTVYTLGIDTNLGLGTNIITDIYLSFGVPGIIILMFLLGFFVNRQLFHAGRLQYYSVLLYACLMSFSVFLVRSTYTHPIKLIIWCLLIGVMNRTFTQKLLNKN